MTDDPRLKNLKPFKPGQSGNPRGRPSSKLPPPPNLTLAKYRDMLDRFAHMTKAELQAAMAAPTTNALEAWVINAFIQGIDSGDFSRLEPMLNRRIGKVKEEIEVAAKPYVIERLDGTTIELGTQALEDGTGEQGEDTEGE